MGVILHQDVKYGNTGEIFNTISKKLKPGTTDEYVNSEENPFGKPMCPNRNDGTREDCLPADDQTFFIQIYATKDYMLYYIANESTQQLSGFREMNRTVAGHGGAGLAFGVICDNDNRETYDCEVSPFVIGPGTGPNNDYTVDIYDINSQWF